MTSEFVALPGEWNCPICRKTGIHYVSRFPGNGPSKRWANALVSWCVTCGSGRVRDAESLIDGYYNQDYAEMRSDRHLPPHEYFSEEMRNGAFRGYYERVEDHLRILKTVGAKMGRVLDFGSGPGYFLYSAKADEPHAVELDESSAKYLDYIGAKRHSVNSVPLSYFDLVMTSHSVEHLTAAQLAPTVKVLTDALAPGGILFIEVPTGGHMHLDMRRERAPHTLFFTPHGLRAAFKLKGMSILYAGTRGKADYPLRGSSPYQPPAGDKFAAIRRNALVLVLKKAG